MRWRRVKVHGRTENEKCPAEQVGAFAEAAPRRGRYGRAPWKSLLALILLAGVSSTACAREDGRVLTTTERIPIPAPAAQTLAIDSVGRMWLGVPGGLWVRDTTAAARWRPVPGEVAPRVIGWSDAGVYLRSRDSLFLVATSADTVAARRGDLGQNPLAIDVRGRAIYQGARSGAVLAHDPATLEPIWAWAALNAPTTAIAPSPEGDRIYQALGAAEEGPRILIRDLQTGRVLGEAELRDPLHELVAASSGVLYGLTVDGRRAVIVALEPHGQELATRWRRGVPAGAFAGELSIRVVRGRVLVEGLGPQTGIRVLRAADGVGIGRTSRSPLDAAFGPGGALWALYPGELRRLE